MTGRRGALWLALALAPAAGCSLQRAPLSPLGPVDTGVELDAGELLDAPDPDDAGMPDDDAGSADGGTDAPPADAGLDAPLPPCEQNMGPVGLTPDRTTYRSGEIVQLTFTGMPTASDAWLAIGPACSARDDDYVLRCEGSTYTWCFTSGAASGTVRFEVPAGLAGRFQARAYGYGTSPRISTGEAFSIE